MQIVLNLQGHRLLAGIRKTLSSGSKEVDEIKLEVDETWKGFGKIAVFCVEKKCQYTVVDEVTQTAKIPAEVLRNEAVITIGIVGFKDEAVMTSTLVAYQVEKGSVVTIEEPEPSIYAEILSRYADLATRLNNIIANAGDLTNNAELIDARVGADDVVYDTLGEAIRGQMKDIGKEVGDAKKQVIEVKSDLGNLREIEFYPNLLNKAEFLDGKQMVTSTGSAPDDLVDNENTTTTNIIDCDGDEYFETNLPNGHTVILAYFWHQEKWYRSQFISTLETEGDHYKFKINAQMKKIRIYCTSNMMPANPILTKQGEYDESKPEFFPKGKIKLTPSGCVGYDNLDEDTKQRINNKTSNYSEYIPFYGKKIVGIGDSIMVGINSDSSAIIDGIDKNGLPCTDQGYQINSTGGFLGELRKKYPSINVVNMGVGSTTMQRNDNVNANKVYKCISDRIDSIPDDADIIILEGGINDFFHASKGCVLGTYKDNLYKYPTSAKYENGAYSYVEFAVDTTLDASTFCGALEIALTKILVRFVGKPFIYVIPHNPSASADIDTFFNSAKEICEKYGVPVVDIRKAGCMPRIYTLSGKTDGTSAFTQDGVHPNPLGYQLHYVPAIASTLKSIM